MTFTDVGPKRQIYLGVLRCPGDVRERGTKSATLDYDKNQSHHSSVLIYPLVLKSIPHVKNVQSANQINTLCLFLSCTLPHLISVTVFNLHSPILCSAFDTVSLQNTCTHTLAHAHTQMSLMSKTPIAGFPQSFLFLFWFFQILDTLNNS